MKKLSNEEFIEKAKEVHGNKYDYSIAGEKLTIKDDFGSDVVYEKKK